jgi:hypothetical protein
MRLTGNESFGVVASDFSESRDIHTEPGHTISGLGILTANRPQLLHRGLSSYIENIEKHRRQIEHVVFDDSKNATDHHATREVAIALARKFKARIRFAGFDERTRFARHLEEFPGISKHVLRNALLQPQGYTLGQNRNALLLDSVGTLFLCVDDDTVCRFVTPPNPVPKLRFFSNADPAEFWCLGGAAETAPRNQVDVDLFETHEALLGRTVEDACRIIPSVQREWQTCGLAAARSADSVVTVTLNGLLGDCAWGAPFGFWHVPMGFLAFDNASLERLISSEQNYRQALRSRQILRITSSPVISDATFSMLTFWGLDNRDLLPPNVPVNRGQDLVFGQLLWKCFNKAVFGHVPLALIHDPVPPRRFWDGEILRSAVGVDLCRLMIEAISLCEIGNPTSSPRERLKVIGQHLICLADQPGGALGERLLERLQVSNRRFVLETIEKASQVAGKHHYVRDVFGYCEKVKAAQYQQDYWVPLDLRLNRSTLKSEERTRTVLRQFGELLVEWPAIVKGAMQLRQAGIRLSVPL